MKLLNLTVFNKQGILVTLVVLGLIVSSSWGQYELSWYTIDGGGGRSSGGQYELLGTIGQPDAGWSRGGDYELLGGFCRAGHCALWISPALQGSLNTGLNQEPVRQLTYTKTDPIRSTILI